MKTNGRFAVCEKVAEFWKCGSEFVDQGVINFFLPM
jgi:hypothetical protein